MAVLLHNTESRCDHASRKLEAEGRAVLPRNMEGLVLIDELDLHLHPRWQAEFVRALKATFPRLQFVVTTHSPLVLRDTEPGEAYELQREPGKTTVTARKIGAPRDWYLTDVYADAFHVDLPPPGTESSPSTPSLVEDLLRFHAAVKEFKASGIAEKRVEALETYGHLIERVPIEDPRRRAMEDLRGLLG